jgi:hypothetical protein
MGSAERHGLFQNLQRSDDAEGVVWKIEQQKPCIPSDIGGDVGKVGKKSPLFPERKSVSRSIHESGQIVVDGVSRVRKNTGVTVLHEGKRQMGEPLLGSPKGKNLPAGVRVHAEPFGVPIADGFRKVGENERIAVGFILPAGGHDLLKDRRSRCSVRTALAEIDYRFVPRSFFRAAPVDHAEDAFVPLPGSLCDVGHFRSLAFSFLGCVAPLRFWRVCVFVWCCDDLCTAEIT